jgi:hypothetical protein
MIWTQEASRVLVADRLHTLQAAYSPDPRPAAPRRSRRSRRIVCRASLAARHA